MILAVASIAIDEVLPNPDITVCFLAALRDLSVGAEWAASDTLVLSMENKQ